MQKTTTEKLTKKQKKGVHLKLFIDGHLLAAGALLAPSGTARSPDQVSVSSRTFSSSSLSSFPPFSLTTNAYCSSCCCDHTLPPPCETPPPPGPLRRVPSWDLGRCPPRSFACRLPRPLARACHSPDGRAEDFSDFSQGYRGLQ